MKRAIRLAGCLVVGLACSRAASAQSPPAASQPAPAAPKLVLSQEAWDFGQVWHPESPSLVLTVKNEGGAELKLTNVRTTCGCTPVEAGRREVPPGGTTELKIRFETQGKQDKVTSKVIIESNDPARPKVDFHVSGFVKRVIRRTPLGGLVIRSLDPNPGQTGTVRLENQVDEPMELKLLSSSASGVYVEIKEVTPGRVYDVVGRTTQVMRTGLTRGEMLFSTGLKQESTITVPASVYIMSLVDPIPPVVYLEPTLVTQPGQRVISLNYYGSLEDFRVTGATCKQAPDLNVTIGPARPPAGGMETLTPRIKSIVTTQVMVPAAQDLPPGGLVIEYATNDPACPKAVVRVTNDRRVWEEVVSGPRGGQGNTPP